MRLVAAPPPRELEERATKAFDALPPSHEGTYYPLTGVTPLLQLLWPNH